MPPSPSRVPARARGVLQADRGRSEQSHPGTTSIVAGGVDGLVGAFLFGSSTLRLNASMGCRAKGVIADVEVIPPKTLTSAQAGLHTSTFTLPLRAARSAASSTNDQCDGGGFVFTRPRFGSSGQPIRS